MQVASLLQFERRLPGDGKSGPAADRYQALGGGERCQRRAPVELGGRCQAVGQAVRETLQAVLAEALTNPDLRAAAARTLLAPSTAADVPPENPTTPPERPRGLFRRASDVVKAGLGAAAPARASSRSRKRRAEIGSARRRSQTTNISRSSGSPVTWRACS